ncbi:MAG: OapB/ArvB family protein [Nanoarchaeota archaeon]
MLTLQYIPHVQIQNLSPDQRIKKLLNLVSENKILLIEGKLKKDEEATLIQRTMEQIGQNADDNFKGIELSTIDPKAKHADREFFNQLKTHIVNMLMGDRTGMTIIGPASIVKEIKQDPDKVELLINNLSTKISTKKKKNSGNGKSKRKK